MLRNLFRYSETNSEAVSVLHEGSQSSCFQYIEHLANSERCHEAITLLLQLVDKAEAEAVQIRKDASAVLSLLGSVMPSSDVGVNSIRLELTTFWRSVEINLGWGVEQWHYEQLAILYQKEKLHLEEVAILERYAAQPRYFSVCTRRLDARLVKAKDRLARGRFRKG